MTESSLRWLASRGQSVARPAYVVCFVAQLTTWHAVRSRQREPAKHTSPWPGPPAENLHAASPSFAAVPPLLDVVTHRLPPAYGPWLAAYVRGRRPLPPGH